MTSQAHGTGLAYSPPDFLRQEKNQSELAGQSNKISLPHTQVHILSIYGFFIGFLKC